MAIGSIKRQKQRPGAERICSLFEKKKSAGTAQRSAFFSCVEEVQAKLDEMVRRQLLVMVRIGGANGDYSYREINSAIPIVAINNPIKTRVHLVPEEGE